jgi:hypothetical protein
MPALEPPPRDVPQQQFHKLDKPGSQPVVPELHQLARHSRSLRAQLSPSARHSHSPPEHPSPAA